MNSLGQRLVRLSLFSKFNYKKHLERIYTVLVMQRLCLLVDDVLGNSFSISETLEKSSCSELEVCS